MDIQIVSTGEKIFKCDDGAARALLAAFPESFCKIEKPAPPPLASSWIYFCGALPSGRYAIQRQKNAETQFLVGTPEQIKGRWPDTPPAVLEQYTALAPDDRAGIV